MTYGIVSLSNLRVDSMESRPGLETAAEYDDEQLEALLSAIGSDVTKAKQSLEANIRGVDDALEDLFVRGEIYATDNERSTVNQEPVAYLHASNIEIPAIIHVPPSTSDASTPAIAESSQRDLCRTCGTKVCNDHFTALRGLKGQCLHCHILHCDPDPVDSSRDIASSVTSELTNDANHHDNHDIDDDIDHDDLVAVGEFTNSDDDDDYHDDIDHDSGLEVANDEDHDHDIDHDINYDGDRDHDIDYDDDHAVGATMSDSAPRLLSPLNRYESNGEPPAVLGQAPEDSVEEESAEEDSIEEKNL